MADKTKEIISVLGTDYKLIYTDKLDDSEGGYIDFYKKEILINKTLTEKELIRHTILHEIVHAMLFESGLEYYSKDETLVDWIAHKLPQLQLIIKPYV